MRRHPHCLGGGSRLPWLRMHWIVPLLLLFGFLAGAAPHDKSFSIVIPVAAYAALVPLAWSLWKSGLKGQLVIAGVLLAVLAVAMTPIFAALAVGTGGGALLLASRFGQTTGKRLVVAGIAGLFSALVVEPAGLALGVWHYASPGLYYGFPPSAMLSWFCMTAAVCTLALYASKDTAAVPLRATTSAIGIIAFTTGVCVAFGLWPAALLGLLLLQFGFHVLHYV